MKKGAFRPFFLPPEMIEVNVVTLDKARELIATQLAFGGGYNRNAVRLILGEVQREHGQQAVDRLIKELGLDEAFDLSPGTDFSAVGR
jgi:hypothetical protein